jgi:CO/xanthine dehydrogenase FAD-binding subunit
VKPPRFEYHDPDTLDEALALLSEHGDEAKPIAGGQSLMPLLNFRLAAPGHLIDLNRIDGLADVSLEDGALRLGCMVRHRTVERSPVIREHVPLLSRVAPFIAHPQIRTRGTFGGSLAHADPAAELPAAVVALDATINTRGVGGGRSIPAGEFFQSFLTTALEPDELIVSVEIPLPAPRTGFGFEELALRRGDFALAGALASVTLDGEGSIEQTKIACLSAASARCGCKPSRPTCVGAVRPSRRSGRSNRWSRISSIPATTSTEARLTGGVRSG